MGAGTREADRLADQQNEGPFLVLFDIGGGVGAGMFTNPTLAETLEDVQAHVEAAEKASDGNVTVRSIKLRKVLALPQLIEAMKELYGCPAMNCVGCRSTAEEAFEAAGIEV